MTRGGDGRANAEGAALLARLAALPDKERVRALSRLSKAQATELRERWTLWAHAGQIAPPGDWRVWLIRAGRGFGKTRAGAEWVVERPGTMPWSVVACWRCPDQD